MTANAEVIILGRFWRVMKFLTAAAPERLFVALENPSRRVILRNESDFPLGGYGGGDLRFRQ